MLTAQYCTGHWPFNCITYRYVHSYCGNAQSNTVHVSWRNILEKDIVHMYVCRTYEIVEQFFLKKCIHKFIWTGVT